jgi:hypothetical protein
LVAGRLERLNRRGLFRISRRFRINRLVDPQFLEVCKGIKPKREPP